MFDLYNEVIKSTDEPVPYGQFEQLRSKLVLDRRSITVEDLGSGSHVLKGNSRIIGDIARTSLTPAKYSRIYDRLINFLDARHIVELGTSFGINTLYLANGTSRQVTTFEGSEEIAFIAQTTFEFAAAANINLIHGNIDKTLSQHTQVCKPVDFALIDANHTYSATIRYFNQLTDVMSTKGVIVIDDIHHTPDMEKAWLELRKRQDIYSTLDLYRCGIIFMDTTLNKQHLVLQL